MPMNTRNGASRQNSPTRDDVAVLASSSEGSIKELLTMLLNKVDGVDRRVNEMQGDINVQGEFTTLHEDVIILRDRVEHHSASIPLTHQAGVGNGSYRSHRGGSEAEYSHHLSHHDYDDEDEDYWRRRSFHNRNERGGGRGNHRFNREPRENNREGYEGEGPRYDDPSRNFKHTIPEFHGKFEPDAYLEWKSQVDKIFSLHNYSEDDKVKLAITEFRGHANTWWSDLMRRRKASRRGEVRTWVELNDLMRATFVPRSYYHKLKGELQDLKQGSKSVMEYYYELIALKGRVGIEESEEVTQDRFIHGLNVHLKHKVQVEAMRGLTMDEVLGFAETFEREGKEKSVSKEKVAFAPTSGGGGESKWSTPQRKGEEPATPSTLSKTPMKALTAPPLAKWTPQAGERRPQCFKCKGFGHYHRECINQRVMVIGADVQIYSEEEDEADEGEGDESCLNTNIGFSSEDELTERVTNLVVLRMLSAQPKQDECVEQRSNIFRMMCKV